MFSYILQKYQLVLSKIYFRFRRVLIILIKIYKKLIINFNELQKVPGNQINKDREKYQMTAAGIKPGEGRKGQRQLLNQSLSW